MAATFGRRFAGHGGSVSLLVPRRWSAILVLLSLALGGSVLSAPHFVVVRAAHAPAPICVTSSPAVGTGTESCARESASTPGMPTAAQTGGSVTGPDGLRPPIGDGSADAGLSSGLGAPAMSLATLAPRGAQTAPPQPTASNASDAVSGIGTSGSRGGSFVAAVLAIGIGGLTLLDGASANLDLAGGLAVMISAVFAAESSLVAPTGGFIYAALVALLAWALRARAARIFRDYRGRLTWIFFRPLVRPG